MPHASDSDKKLAANIEEFGFSVILIEVTDYLPSFGYTVGLYKKYGHPELIAFGLSTKTLLTILNIGGEMVKNGQILQQGKIYGDFFENGNAQFLPVDPRNIPDYFGYAIWFNEARDFASLQLVWTDRKGKYPWEEGFELDLADKQPLLDRNADFKYKESKNLAVFTTRQHLEMNKPILRVIHDLDGEWQFLTEDQMPSDIRIVALDQMVKRDNSLNDLFNLDYGEFVEREKTGAKWER